MGNDIYIPPMKQLDELEESLSYFPAYDEEIRKHSSSERIIALNSIYKVFFPFPMSKEIYTRLYLSLSHSMSKKRTREATIQAYNNHNATFLEGIIGSADCMTIIAEGGVGKSRSVGRAIEIIGDGLIELHTPYQKIVPFLSVQCPFDSSVKGMLLEILRRIDECLSTDFYESATRKKATTDVLIGLVSQICLMHIGVLIIDEIQNIAKNTNGKNIIGCLTQLINSSGISIVMVGTPDIKPFFQSNFFLARRTVGIEYGPLGYDDVFKSFCKKLFSYQFTKNKSTISESIINFLYEHSNGITAVVVGLLHDSQEIAIVDGTETIDLRSLSKAYKNRLNMINPFINRGPVHHSKLPASKIETPAYTLPVDDENLVARLSKLAVNSGVDVVEVISSQVIVEEI